MHPIVPLRHPKARRRFVKLFSSSFDLAWVSAPGAYKNVDAVVEVAEKAGLARRVARLKPVICIKG